MKQNGKPIEMKRVQLTQQEYDVLHRAVNLMNKKNGGADTPQPNHPVFQRLINGGLIRLVPLKVMGQTVDEKRVVLTSAGRIVLAMGMYEIVRPMQEKKTAHGKKGKSNGR